MFTARKVFEQTQKDIQDRLEYSFQFIQASKYDLLQDLTEPEADIYLGILYIKSYFYMQKGLHFTNGREIII
jgi:hypothetical protein